MKEFEIWSEGYLIQGSEGDPARARLIGKIKAESFEAACKIKFSRDPYFDEKTLSYWGCKLFSSKKAAKKSFG